MPRINKNALVEYKDNENQKELEGKKSEKCGTKVKINIYIYIIPL